MSNEPGVSANQRARNARAVTVAMTPRIIIAKVKAMILGVPVVKWMGSTNPLVAVIAEEEVIKGLVPLDDLLVQYHLVHVLAATRVT